MKKEYKYRLVIGAAILLVTIALQMFWSGISPAITMTLMVAGIALMATGAIRHMTCGEGPESDERTKRISAFALSCSWVVTLLLVCVLILLDHYTMLKIAATQALGLTLFVMIAVAVVSEWYLKRKGDIA